MNGSGTEAEAASQRWDPLQSAVPLPFHRQLFPFGFAAHVRSNRPEVIDAADYGWSDFRKRFDAAPIEVRVVVSDEWPPAFPREPVFRAQANLLTLIADAQHFGCCDLATGFGFACVTAAALSHSNYFRYHFLDAMIATLLNARHMVTVHAACVAKQGRGVLLAGDTGAGKSSLAYACARRGWTYVSDDACSLVLDSSRRTIVGNPRTFRFRPEAVALFPEVSAPTTVRAGKPTMEVQASRFPDISCAETCCATHVVFLDRWTDGLSGAHLATVPREECLWRLSVDPLPPELPVVRARSEAIGRLAGAVAFRLTYAQLEPAVELLDQVVGL